MLMPDTGTQVNLDVRVREDTMEELVFLVQGSTTDPYEVTFIKDGASLTALCTCPAGTYGNFCKHRISILDGNTNAISSDNADQAVTVVGWLPGTDVEAALSEMREAEKIADPDKKVLNTAKRKLARAMNS
jgi:hypothetical protein